MNRVLKDCVQMASLEGKPWKASVREFFLHYCAVLHPMNSYLAAKWEQSFIFYPLGPQVVMMLQCKLESGPTSPKWNLPTREKGQVKILSKKITLTSWIMGTCGASHTFHTLLAKAIQIVALERCHNQIPHRNLPPRRSRTRCPPVWHKDYVTWTLHMH